MPAYSCDDGCANECYKNCWSECYGGCGDTCQDDCNWHCDDECKGCTGQCRYNCTGSCDGTCRGHCTGNCASGCSSQTRVDQLTDIQAMSDIIYSSEVNILKDFIVAEMEKRNHSSTINDTNIGIEADDAWWNLLTELMAYIYEDNSDITAIADQPITKNQRNNMVTKAKNLYNTEIPQK